MNANCVLIDGQYYSPKHDKVKAYYANQTKTNAQSVGGLRPAKPESNQRGKGEDTALVKSQESVHYLVTFTVYRRRLLDSHDNARSALKPIVDLVTKTLGFTSDDCEQLKWEYHQVKTRGLTGTHITISRV